MLDIKKLYGHDRFVVTAHRGASGIEPENTMRSFKRAVEIGADIVEFDVRATSDGELMIMHDISLDRTTNGHGLVHDNSWSDIKKLYASYWQGTHDKGSRLDKPLYDDVRVPLFEEAIEWLAGRSCINIQVYVDTREQMQRICEIYRKHNLYGSAFLMVSDFATAEFVRSVDPKILLCVGEARENIARHKLFGVDFMQPWRALLCPEYDAAMAMSKLPSNVFFANNKLDMEDVISHKVSGFLTDRCDIAVELRDSFSSITKLIQDKLSRITQTPDKNWTPRLSEKK